MRCNKAQLGRPSQASRLKRRQHSLGQRTRNPPRRNETSPVYVDSNQPLHWVGDWAPDKSYFDAFTGTDGPAVDPNVAGEKSRGMGQQCE
ncbi:hypothetical protein SNK03_001922 [Fusarium graminearum]|uniref:Uncharacterized protein n=1 Tax=Gibberella zeae TaxID=5518 RepID=A0A4E9D2H4_GIBZA|nr:unnamed protein product [Fusarium graminearum]CAF3602749.1 unnamed protein product [Fusarium graminearum]CAG1964377.1 unnamed protein product [Fusarium graminearum]CAG1969481.1 unnamed protein product [Fusarium graminearum]